MKDVMRNMVGVVTTFLSIPVIVHLCILNLIIKLKKHSIKEAKYFKPRKKKAK